MKRAISILLVLFVVMSLFVACKQPEPEAQPEPEPEGFEGTYKSSGESATTAYGVLYEYTYDMILVFYKNGTFSYTLEVTGYSEDGVDHLADYIADYGATEEWKGTYTATGLLFEGGTEPEPYTIEGNQLTYGGEVFTKQ